MSIIIAPSFLKWEHTWKLAMVVRLSRESSSCILVLVFLVTDFQILVQLTKVGAKTPLGIPVTWI